jgi:hypothetical protein
LWWAQEPNRLECVAAADRRPRGTGLPSQLTASLPPPIRLREIWLSRDGLTGQVLSNGGVTLGYVAGANALTTAADAAVLTV